MVTRKLKEQIKEAVIKGIQRNADRIFDISQSTAECYVPTDTGVLKKSGAVNYLPNGAEILYTANYSSAVEFGIPSDIPIEGTQIVKVRAFKRRGGAIVKAHEKKYVNKKVIGFRPKFSKFEFGAKMFRVIDKIKARAGQFFLSRSVQEGIKDLSNDIEFYMKRIK